MKRLHRIVPVVILAAFMLGIMAGCEQDRALLEVSSPAEPEVVVNDANRTVTITDSSQPNRPLVIRGDLSTHTEYLDCGEFHMVIAPGYVQEFTSRDFFEMSAEDLGNGRHLEHYYYNGSVLDLEIDDASGPTEEQRLAFLDFYPADPAVNSLQGHPDGLRLVNLLSRAEPSLRTIIQDRTGRPAGAKDDGLPELQLRPRWADMTCGAAHACSMVACKLGFQNPVCIGCSIVVVACALMDIFGLW
jgi:hypothetical protein